MSKRRASPWSIPVLAVCAAGVVLALGLLPRQSAAAEEGGITTSFSPLKWPSTPPADCPFPASPKLGPLVFTGRSRAYKGGDTWYLSWASDDRMYSPFTDGQVAGVSSGSGQPSHKDKTATVGFVAVEGGDPMNLTFVGAGIIPVDPFPYGGQYPCGSLVHEGVWYYGSYSLDTVQDDWDVMGPFVGFRVSLDYGKTWLPAERTAMDPLFGESAKDGRPVKKMGHKAEEYERWEGRKGKPGAKVKLGAPHVVDFSKNMQHSPDGKAYLVAHGAVRPEAYNTWIAGDQVYLFRVRPSVKTINDPASYEFFGGHDGQGAPIWTGDFSKIRPLLEWNGHLGCVTATYNAPLRKYLMCITDGGGPAARGRGPYNTLLLEADALTGPYRLVTYMSKFGEQAYFVNIPSRFIGADGRTFWLCYAHGWSHKTQNPPNSHYGMTLQEVTCSPPGKE